MTELEKKIRERLYQIFYDLGVPSSNTDGMEKPYVIEAADQILALIEQTCKEVIGEDGEVSGYMRPNGMPSVDLTESYNNLLRATQRKRLKQLMGGK